MAHDPGERFFYDEVSTHLLSVLLTRLTGLSAAAFAHTALFRPLGIWADERVRFLWERAPEALHRWHESGRWASDGLPWTIDRHNHNTGGFGLHLTARELAKLGYLYVNSGSWDGAQLIPPDFVEESTRRQNGGGPPVGRPHGYLWWIPEPHRAFFAAGLGGQTLHVVPGLDLVTVFTTLSVNRAAEHRGQVLEHFVIPAVRDR
jgi:CubicO group peptidase (beta-lactamase class C family)